MKNYYEIIGAPIFCDDQAQIKASYRKMLMFFHPDGHNVSPDIADEKSKQLNEAYQVLSDETKKREYDRKLRDYYKSSSSKKADKRSTESSDSSTSQSSKRTSKSSESADSQQSSQQGTDYEDGRTIVTQTMIKHGNMALEDHQWEWANSCFKNVIDLDPICAEAYIGMLLAREHRVDWSSLIEKYIAKNASYTTQKIEACAEDTEHIEMMVRRFSVKGYVEADDLRALYAFNRNYDSAVSCRRQQKSLQIEELNSEWMLTRARQYAKGDTKKQIEEGLSYLIDILEKRIIKAKEDAVRSIDRVREAYKAHIAEADRKAEELYLMGQEKLEDKYQKAVSLVIAASDIAGFEIARDAMRELNGYKDSDELAQKCQWEIGQIMLKKQQEYDRQNEELQKEYEHKKEKKRRIQRIVIATVGTIIIMISIIVGVVVPRVKYRKALQLINKSEYIAAYKMLENLKSYKDSSEIKASIEDEYQDACNKLLAQYSIGSTITFGSYEQDNDTSNGQESIEWIVLAHQENYVLLISKFALDCKPFNKQQKGISWEKCSLRHWLNGNFMNHAFTSTEIDRISSPESETFSFNPEEEIFLLSVEEAENFFDSAEERQCSATRYAIAHSEDDTDVFWRNGTEAEDAHIYNYSTQYDNGNEESSPASISDGRIVRYWLRSNGATNNRCAAYVNAPGTIIKVGNDVSDIICVRPALWLEILG